MDFNEIKNCALCGGDNFKTVYKTYDHHYGIKGDYTFDQCQNCNLVFLNPVPTEEYLTSQYPTDYYAYQEFYEKKPSLIKKIYKDYLVKIKTKDPKFDAPGKILDIGCGSGLFLYKMKQQGWEVYGEEVNASAAKLGNDAENLNIHIGDLMSAKYESNFFDYVRSNHSLEHITNPNEVLEEVHRILKPGGKLFIGVPNIDSFNARLFKEYWWYLCAPVHAFNYSIATLTQMLEKHGFVVEKVHHNGDYAGILGSLQLYLNRNIKSNAKSKGAFKNNKLLAIIAHRAAKVLNLLKVSDVMEFVCTKKELEA